MTGTVRRWAAFAAVTLTAVVAAACSAPAAPAPAEIVWATGSITADGPARDVAELWNARHPTGPRVRLVPLLGGADEQRQQLAVEMNAGLPTFDVVDLDVIWTAEFARKGWLRDMEDLRDELDATTLPGPLATAVWNDTLWAAPYSTDAGILYFRKDLMTRAPQTWDELSAVTRRIGAERSMTPFVADGEQNEGLTVQYLEYLWSARGDLLSPDARSAVLQQEPATRALRYMQDSYRSGVYPPSFSSASLEEARLQFQSGKVVAMRSWPYAYRLMNETDSASKVAGKIGIARLPRFDADPSDPTTPVLGGHNLGINASSRHPDEATEFIRFAISPEVQRLLAERHSVAPTLAGTYDELAGQPVIDLLRGVLPYARPRPATPEWSAVTQEIQQQVFAAYTGTQDPGRTVTDLRTVLSSTTEQP